MKKRTSNLFIIGFFIILLILISCQTFLTKFSIFDEIWNFQSIYKMHNGGQIYTDCNVLITPFFFVLGNILFSIFHANLFTFRIYNILIYLLEYILLYRIFRKLGTPKILSILYLTCWFVLSNTFISAGANYNVLGIAFVFLGILFYLNDSEKKYYHFGQGILIFLVFFTKQTIGIYYAFGVVLFELIEIGFQKKFFTNQLLKLCTFLPCVIIACSILFYKGNLFHFINLCFGNLLEFGSSNFSISWTAFPNLSFMILTITFSIFMIKKADMLLPEQKRNIKFLLCIAIALSFNILPLANQYHMNLVITFYFLLFIHSLDVLFIREVFISRTHTKILLVICVTIFLLYFVKLGYYYFTNVKPIQHFASNHPFFNAPIEDEVLEKINSMTNYISQKRETGTNVLVLSHESAAFMVPLKLNNNEFDLLFSGNLGYKGIQKTIDKLSHIQNTEFLLFTNEEDCFYQEPKEIREYIIRHFKKTGEFLNYSIYIND